MANDITWKDGQAKAEAKVEEPKASKPKAKKRKAAKRTFKYHKTGIITTEHLEKEFGMKAKVIRRYLRKMEESSKPRGPQRYEWDATSKELAKIRKNLEAVVLAKEGNIK